MHDWSFCLKILKMTCLRSLFAFGGGAPDTVALGEQLFGLGCTSSLRSATNTRKLGAHASYPTSFFPNPLDALTKGISPDPSSNTADDLNEQVSRQVVNSYPVMPFVIPIPAGGDARMTRSNNMAHEMIPSAHDLGSTAKWNGFWSTVKQVIQHIGEKRIAGGGMGGYGNRPPPDVFARRPQQVLNGMVGADFLYETPINALGQPDITAPMQVTTAGMAMEAGNPFL